MTTTSAGSTSPSTSTPASHYTHQPGLDAHAGDRNIRPGRPGNKAEGPAGCDQQLVQVIALDWSGPLSVNPPASAYKVQEGILLSFLPWKPGNLLDLALRGGICSCAVQQSGYMLSACLHAHCYTGGESVRARAGGGGGGHIVVLLLGRAP